MEGGAGNELRGGASGGILFAQSDAQALEGTDRAVFGVEFDGLNKEFKGDAFALNEIVFVGVGGHLVFGAAIDHGDAFGTEALGDGGAIDGGVAGADHDNVSADFEVRGAEFALFDVFEAVKDEFFAGNAEARSASQADTEEDGLKAGLQIGEMEIVADGFAGLQFDAETLNHGDLGESDVDGFAEADDAVGGEAAGKIAALKDGDAVAKFGEFTGTGKTCGACTDDGDGMAGGLGDRKELQGVGVKEIHGVALQAADGDGLVFGAQDASAFAKFLNGADAGAGGAEEIGFEDGAGRAFEIVGGDFLDEFGDVDVSGAGVGAGRVVAHEAAGGLDEGFLGREGRQEFLQCWVG